VNFGDNRLKVTALIVGLIVITRLLRKKAAHRPADRPIGEQFVQSTT